MLTEKSLLMTLIHATAAGQGQHFFDGRHERRRPVTADYASLDAKAQADYTPARVWNDETKTFDAPPAPQRPDDEPGWRWDDEQQTYMRL